MPYPTSPNIHGGGGPEARRRQSPVISRNPRDVSIIGADTDTNETYDEMVARCHQETTRLAEVIMSWLQWDSESDFEHFRDLPKDTKNQLLHASQALEGILNDDVMETEDDESNSKSDQPASYPAEHYTTQSDLELSLAKSIERLITENLDLKAQLTNLSGPQPTSPHAAGLEASIHAPANPKTHQKSANPTPINPQRKFAPQLPTSQPPRQKPTSPTQRHHDSRLIIHFTPRIDHRTLDHPGRIVQDINNALRTLSPPPPAHFRVKGMITSEISGAPIIIAADGCTASDLEAYSRTIYKIVAGKAQYDYAEAKADRQRFEVCLENVPLRSYLGEELQPDIVESIVAETSGLRENMQLATQPRFMIADADRARKCWAPVCLSFFVNKYY